MKPLKTPPSGPHNLEEFCTEIAAFKEKHDGVWNYTLLRRDPEGRTLAAGLQRFADANRMRSRARVARRLGHPFQKTPPVNELEMGLMLDLYREYYKDEGIRWQPTALEKHDRDVYNQLSRMGTYLYSRQHGKRRIGLAAKLLGVPFEKLHSRDGLKNDIAQYKQQPGARWNIKALEGSNGIGRNIYNALVYFACKQAKTRGKYKTMRRIAQALGHPFTRHTVKPAELEKRIAAYTAQPDKVWKPNAVLEDPDGAPLYNDLLYFARKRRREHAGKSLKMLARDVAAELGHPFLARHEHPQQQQLLFSAPEIELAPEQGYAWLEQAFNKLWLLAQFERIHARDKTTGQRAYAMPSHVKAAEPSVAQWSMKLFGSYKNAMDAWEPGAYAASLGKFTVEQFPDDKLEELARNALVPLFQHNGFVSRERFRIAHPDEYHPVEALRKRKKFDTYKDVLEYLGVTPTELTDEEKKHVGHCGELFSLAYFYLRIAAGADNATELHPRTPNEGKLEILTSAYADKIILPDIARGDGTVLKMTEVKAGDSFPYSTGERVLEKYQGTFSVRDGEGVPVHFTDIHIHMPKKHIEEGVLTPFQGNPPLFDQKTISVLTAEDIALAFARYQAPVGLQNAYGEFANRPVWFVKDEQQYAQLEQLVGSLAPERFRPREEATEQY